MYKKTLNNNNSNPIPEGIFWLLHLKLYKLITVKIFSRKKQLYCLKCIWISWIIKTQYYNITVHSTICYFDEMFNWFFGHLMSVYLYCVLSHNIAVFQPSTSQSASVLQEHSSAQHHGLQSPLLFLLLLFLWLMLHWVESGLKFCDGLNGSWVKKNKRRRHLKWKWIFFTLLG